MKQLIKIDKEIINYLRLSYLCHGCQKQVILTPDIWGKVYLSCGECQHSIYIRDNQRVCLDDLTHVFDRCRKILNKNGLQVWIEGQPDTSTLAHGSTTLKRTYYKSPFEK